MKPYCADRVVMETFVGRETVLGRLTSNVLEGRSSMVAAGRRMGKTMLLRRLTEDLQRRGLTAAYVDVQSVQGPRIAEDFVRAVAAASECYYSDHLTLEAIATSVIEHGRKWCLIVDEVELLTRSPETSALLDNIRYLVSNSPATGDATVVIGGGLDLVLDLRSVGSSLTNVCTPVPMTPLHQGDVAVLVGLAVPADLQASMVEYLWENAGGHPYLVQALLEAIPDGELNNAEPVPEEVRDRLRDRLAAQLASLDSLVLGSARALVRDQQPDVHEKEALLSTGLARADGEVLSLNGSIVESALQILPAAAAPPSADPDWYSRLLAQRETPTIEFKETIRWDVNRGAVNDELKYEVPTTVAGFMNAEGGALMLGVTNEGQAVGLARDMAQIRRNPTLDGIFLQLASLLRDTLGGGVAGRVRFHAASTDTDPVLILVAERAAAPVFATFQGRTRFFNRIGTATVEFDARETVQYVLQRWPGIERV